MILAHALYNHNREEFLVAIDNEFQFSKCPDGGKYVTVGVDVEAQELNYIFYQVVSKLVETDGEFDSNPISLVPVYETLDDVTFDFNSAIKLSEILVVKEGIQDGK